MGFGEIVWNGSKTMLSSWLADQKSPGAQSLEITNSCCATALWNVFGFKTYPIAWKQVVV